MFRALLNGVIRARSYSNSRMSGSLRMSVTRPEIPSPSGFSQKNLESILSDWYVQPELESWDLHPGGIPTTSKKIQFSVSLQQERLISFNFQSVSVLVTHHSLRSKEKVGSPWRWLICWRMRWIMSKKGFHFPPWAVRDIKISGSFDRCRPCRCLHLIRDISSFSPMTSFWGYKFV